MLTSHRSSAFLAVVTYLGLFCVPSAFAGIHTWDVREVFSNADGTIQFVELFDPTGPSETGVGNGTLSSNLQSFAFGAGPVVGPTTNKSYLIATPDFAALPGAPTPDVLIPPGSIVFFDTTGDTIAFASDSWAFGAVPTNGTDSLDRVVGAGPNTPTNYAGQTGSVDANPPPTTVPLVSLFGATVLIAALVGAGVVALARRKRSNSWG